MIHILSLIGFGLSCAIISSVIYLLAVREHNIREHLFFLVVGATSIICAGIIGMNL